MKIKVGEVYRNSYLHEILIIAKIDGEFHGGNGGIYDEDGKSSVVRDIPYHYDHLLHNVKDEE